MSRQIKADLLDSVASSPCEFCARQERHRENCKALYAKLGTSLLVRNSLLGKIITALRFLRKCTFCVVVL